MNLFIRTYMIYALQWHFVGYFLQSVVCEGKTNALDVSFVRAPIGMDLDWQFVAKISPCYVTVHIWTYVFEYFWK